MSIIDFGPFTFNGETIMDIRDLVFDAYAKNPDFNNTHNVVSGIVANKEVGFIGEPGLVGVGNQGCNPVSQSWSISTRKVVWEPKPWEVRLEECWENLTKTATTYAMNDGVEITDLTSTDWAAIFSESLGRAVDDFRWRLAWFSDTDALNVSDGGVITNGIPLHYFTIIDGLFKHIMLKVEANTDQRVVIAENAGATYVDQAMMANNVVGYLRSLVNRAPMELRTATDRELMVTQSVYDAYAEYLQDAKAHQQTYNNLVNGMPVLSFDGVPVVAMPVWDRMIKKFENNGTSLNLPHRAIFTTREVLGFGLDSPDSFDSWRFWPEFKDRKVYADIMGKADAKLLNDSLIMAAY